MVIDLSKIEFENDMFSVTTPKGGYLRFNKLDEALDVNGVTTIIKRINIELVTDDSVLVVCPCVIGLGNDFMEIRTKYKELEGLVLNDTNMLKCEVEVYE